LIAAERDYRPVVIGRALKQLASTDPLLRIRALEKVVEHFLWRLPREQVDDHLEIPPPLPQAALEGAKLYANRATMLEMLPKGGVVAEVGTWQGDFSREIIAACRPKAFHLIDIDFAPLDPIIDGIRHEGDSSTILRSFPPASFDWIYIDGDHSYDGARQDLEAAHLVLKPGGYIMCNDYTNWCSLAVQPYGVSRAVNQFVIHEKYLVCGLALAPAGNHDILLKSNPGQ
jgi:SAM-dependent methyltransferase